MKTILFTIFFISFHFVYSRNQNEEVLIRKSRQSSNEAIEKRDVEGFTKFWLDNYVVIRRSGVIEQGKETNKTNWRRIFKETPKTYFERIPSEIIVSKIILTLLGKVVFGKNLTPTVMGGVTVHSGAGSKIS